MTPQRLFLVRRKVEAGKTGWLSPEWVVTKEKNIFGRDHYVLRRFTGHFNPLSCFADWEQLVAVVKELKI